MLLDTLADPAGNVDYAICISPSGKPSTLANSATNVVMTVGALANGVSETLSITARVEASQSGNTINSLQAEQAAKRTYQVLLE